MITRKPIVLYEQAAISIKTASGETIISMNPGGDGQRQTVSVAPQILNVCIDAPECVDMYVNKQMIPLDDYSGEERVEFTIDLAEY
ncbi:hypothetical protein SV7mr_30080 [Stieleria bergensis]|uniref:Uncharacterized protein n=2 Tax=Stieleria bergensis TaxID=2528025 RepID=A0A517SWH2_9BACT|nr:hypothetical protein [bacterium]MDB4533158.1 hypothetical protein [bacterium]QDT60485.1 hypothetical protein SV7mr_30080 [Planctomycetes bacterium SV_7m_r]